MTLQIGAIYLWSYVYNIVRISSRSGTRESEANEFSISKPARESSTSDLGVREPLLSSPKEFLIPENNKDQYALPCTRAVARSEVISSYYLLVLGHPINTLLLFHSHCCPDHKLTHSINLRNSCSRTTIERGLQFSTIFSPF